MPTVNIVPRANNEGKIGTPAKKWLEVNATTIKGNLAGNATTATILQNARTINGVAFNGSANITINAKASDVYAWAKAANKPGYTKAEVGLGNVDNTADSAKRVSYANTAGSASTAGTANVANSVAWGNVTGKPASLGSSVAVLTGSTSLTGSSSNPLRFTAPLPAGFTEAQCKFIHHFSSSGYQSGSDHNMISKNFSGIAFQRTIVAGDGKYVVIGLISNYIVIGVK